MQELNTGLIYVFTGDGKGKTSAAFWTGVRAALAGMKVAVVQWYKESRWPTAEQMLPAVLAGSKGRKSSTSSIGSFEVYLMGKGFYKLPTDHATPQMHRQAAAAGLRQAEQLIDKVDMLILDEVNNAVSDGLIDLIDLIDLISKRGKTHIIITGRNASAELVEAADLVTEMKKIKHPFDQGKRAVKGLDY